MKAIKFVQWSSSISICLVIIAGLLCLFTSLATVSEWSSFAVVAAMFIAPEKVAAFFGNIIKRKQEAARPPEGQENG